jgi:putative membrane protein
MRAPSLTQLLVGHWRPVWTLNVQAAVYGAIYVWSARRARGRWPMRRTLSFLAGIAVVLVALESGIDTYDDRLLSVHMVQHMLLLLVGPLLLLGGRPVILALRVLPRNRRAALADVLRRSRAVTRPAVCLGAFSAVVIASHLPSFYDATLRNPELHDLEHIFYLFAGLLLWWPILDGDPVPAHRLGGLGRLLYILAAMPAMALVGAYLNRHAAVVYPPYSVPARALGVSPVVDQQQAGAVMWVAGSTIMVAVGLWVSVAALVAEERRQRGRDARFERTRLIDPAAEGGGRW